MRQLSIEYQNIVTLVEENLNTTISELVTTRLRPNGLLFRADWAGADQLAEVNLIHSQNSSLSKPLRNQNQTIEQAGLLDGAQLQINLSNAIRAQLSYQDNNNNHRKDIILPSFLPVQMLVDELVDRLLNVDQDSYYLHIIDSDLSSGLRRLLPKQTLQQQGISDEMTLYLHSADFTDNIASKSTRSDIYMTNTDGRSIRYSFPVDTKTNELTAFASYRNLRHKIEQEDEFLIESPPRFPVPQPSGSDPIVIPRTDLGVFSGPDVRHYSWLGVLSAGERTVATGISADRDWWQIVYPHRSLARGWIEASYTEAHNVQDLPIIPKPQILSQDMTLWEAGVRQNAPSFIQLNERFNLVEYFAKRFGEKWKIRRLADEKTTELSLRFLARYDPKEEIYFRLLSDTVSFQTPIFKKKYVLIKCIMALRFL